MRNAATWIFIVIFSQKRLSCVSARYCRAISKESRLQCWYMLRSFPPIPRVISRATSVLLKADEPLSTLVQARAPGIHFWSLWVPVFMSTCYCQRIPDIIAWQTFLLIFYLVSIHTFSAPLAQEVTRTSATKRSTYY